MTWHEPVTGGAPGSDAARTTDAIERRFKIPHKTVLRTVPAGERATSSATYVTVPTDLFSVVGFIKYRDDTKLVVTLNISCYQSTASTTFTFGVTVAGTDYDVIANTFNANNNTHEGFSGTREISSIPKGTYTVPIRYKCSSGTLTVGAGDTACLTVEETY